MKLAVSNIAWAPAHRDAAYAILRAHGIEGLEIAPSLLFAGITDPFAPTPAEVAEALGLIERVGLELVSMQSLLFGISGAALFEGEAARDRLMGAMVRAIGLAERLGIPNLVFGSPRQRIIPEGMAALEAETIAVATFRRLGDAATRAGAAIAIEANPRAYGTNFLNRVAEAEAFVRKVDHEGVRLIIDVGALHMNGDFEEIDNITRGAADMISHVHMSEPYLAPAPADMVQAASVVSALLKASYQRSCSIEMRTPETESLALLERSVERFAGAAKHAREGWGA